MRKLVAVAFAMAAICAMGVRAGASVPPSVLTSARIERRGPALELHFGFSGPTPRLDLSTHGTELWIELQRARIAIPPRPLFGQEAAPIVSVRAIQLESGSRIVVEVIGKSDYAIARLKDRNEIVLRVATADTDPNLAAPILVHNDAPRRPVPIVARPVVLVPRENPRAVAVALPIAPVTVNEDNRQPGNFLVMIDPGH